MVMKSEDRWFKIIIGIDKLALAVRFRFCFAIALFSFVFQTSPALAESKIYNPPSITSESEVSDILTENDIPTGDGGFARDYFVQLEKGDQVVIDLTSDNFDSMVMLIAADGATVAENDDGPGWHDQFIIIFSHHRGRQIYRARKSFWRY